ncbi:MAG: MerR family transcriptional regulator [Dehalogenimonas sp.]|uniref:MerR family transcriptional regulator n=1 Tax=Candidatus Dehalogenimonas loeffleri TaxID=3127115 RepID=A0ABZ2J8S8_9CHLR|nr:MerR family transcriptional regulator [Dehalogenimonas sp.]
MAELKYYKTSEVAKAAGVHPNTVRLYEALGLLQPVRRSYNNYRLYTLAHMEQMRLSRIALKSACVEGDIRKKAISIIKTAAKGNLKLALEEAYEYLAHINNEQSKADEALIIMQKWLNQTNEPSVVDIFLGRKETSRLLGISIDVLRNWERNGLLDVPRNIKNGYRVYGQKAVDRAKVIRTLRMANYSMMAIMRMLKAIDINSGEPDIFQIVSSPRPDEDMVYATDRWILTLLDTEKNANELIMQIKRMLNNQSLGNL